MEVFIKLSLCTWQIIKTQLNLFFRKHAPFQIITPTSPQMRHLHHITRTKSFLEALESHICVGYWWGRQSRFIAPV